LHGANNRWTWIVGGRSHTYRVQLTENGGIRTSHKSLQIRHVRQRERSRRRHSGLAARDNWGSHAERFRRMSGERYSGYARKRAWANFTHCTQHLIAHISRYFMLQATSCHTNIARKAVTHHRCGRCLISQILAPERS
jgi:hypothetical protein